MTHVLVLPLVAVSAWLLASPGPMGQVPCGVTYIANAGVLLESGGTRLLIDAPIRQGIPPYATPSTDVSRQLETASPPFDRITAILITHWHEDHFSAEAVAAHLAASPPTLLVSSEEIVARVRAVAPGLPEAQFRAATPSPGTSARVDAGGIPVHVLRIRHNPVRRVPEEHVGFLIDGCRTVLHPGDADPQADNFALLKNLPRVEVGLLPFWYVSGAKSRAFVEASIRPSRVLAVHIPPKDAADVERTLKASSNTTPLTDHRQRVDLQR